MFVLKFIGASGVRKTALTKELSQSGNFIHQGFIVFFHYFKSKKLARILQKISN
ncbi:MAG: hypothetical protein IBX45_13170 [Campylobacterales bacterium]|nr:hypothetical protein [Campylobacterales bacterium]